jgi:hypothetical protein
MNCKKYSSVAVGENLGNLDLIMIGKSNLEFFNISTAQMTEHQTITTNLGNRFKIPNISSIAMARVVESSSSSVMTLEPAKSAIKEAFLN